MFTLRQVVGVVLSPLFLALLVAGLALLLRILGRRRAALITLIASAVLAWLVCTPLVGRLLLSPLETRHAALVSVPADVRFIVVLGSSYSPRGDIPITAALDDAGLSRVIEGLRLHQLAPHARLIFSGSGPAGMNPPALGGTLLAEALGVSRESIQPLQGPRNTREEAAAVCELVGKQRFVVVTSAGHMPRAMEWMRRAGCEGLAAPTGQESFGAVAWWAALVPGSSGLAMSENAVHEYLGWIALVSGIG